MKLYPSVFHAYTSESRPVIGVFEPKHLDEASDRPLIMRKRSQFVDISKCKDALCERVVKLIDDTSTFEADLRKRIIDQQ